MGVSRVSVALVAVVAGTMLTTMAGAARAQTEQDAVVSANPADWTPKLPNDVHSTATYAFAQVGDTMYAGGQFSSANGLPRHNILAFNATTGVMTTFAPNVSGVVWGLAESPDGELYVGGTFSSINGVPRRGIAKIDLLTGAVDPTFVSPLNDSVYDVRYACGRLFVSGTFSKRLEVLDPVTGRDTGYLNLGISGSVGSNAGPTEVYRFAVDPTCTRLAGIGNFTTVSSQTRYRAFVVDLGDTSGSLDPWFYKPLTKSCASDVVDYLRGVDFSPDGTWFVIDGVGYVSKSGDLGQTVCDAAARFETSIPNPSRPTWINYTGGDSLHSVAITGAAVYVGGHQRWLDNPHGTDSAGPGAVSRPGIGAIDPATGKALTWDPRRTRGIGAKVLYATPAGLWVGSDTRDGGSLGCSKPGGVNDDDCTGQPLELHPGIGFLPLPSSD
jgi:hypothetical protein